MFAHDSHTHISGKELIFAALRHEALPATPWVPFAGIHAGKLKGYSALELLTDGGKLVEALIAVNQVYDPDGQPVMFDLQVEAEILGCKLVWAQSAPPSVASHPLGADLTIPTRLPTAKDGRIPMILQAMRTMKHEVGHKTALYGLICGPMTLASHLRGTEIFMDTFDNPEFLHGLIAYCRDVALRMAELYIQAGMDVIAVVDPVVSQVSPRHFKTFLLEPFKQVFDGIRQMGAFSSFFVCGDATKNLDVMCQTAPDSISVDENINLVTAKEITDKYNITIGGNIPLTTRMLLGTQQDNMKFVVDLLDQLGGGIPGGAVPLNFILAPGCDMPYDTPTENTVGVLQAVRHPENTRQMLANYESHTFDIAVELPDYAHLDKPLVEVFTLDSDTCAACGYMMEAARQAVTATGSADLMEYKFTKPENVARVIKMGVKNLPALYINGELKYSSIIPGNKELILEIQKAKRSE